jgi:hypothetical protein
MKHTVRRIFQESLFLTMKTFSVLGGGASGTTNSGRL